MFFNIWYSGNKVSIKVNNNNTNDGNSNNGKTFEEFLTTFPKRIAMAFMEKNKQTKKKTETHKKVNK